jgi:hypothetical protein
MNGDKFARRFIVRATNSHIYHVIAAWIPHVFCAGYPYKRTWVRADAQMIFRANFSTGRLVLGGTRCGEFTPIAFGPHSNWMLASFVLHLGISRYRGI